MINLGKFKILAIALIHVMVVIMGLSVLAVTILTASQTQGYINTTFNLIKSEKYQAGDTDPDDPMYTYFKSDFESVKKVEENGAKYAYDVVLEGTTLLKNEGALPLAKGSKVSLFSASSVRPVYCGTGSGASHPEDQVSFKDGFEKNGNLSVNPNLWKWYGDNASTYARPRLAAGGNPTGGASGMSNNNRISYIEGVLDATWANIPDNVGKADKTYGDAAIFVLGRQSGEGADVPIERNSANSSYLAQTTNDNALELGVREKDVLKNLKALKGTVFNKIIVLMNSASPVQCDFQDDPEYGIDALVWCGAFGDQGPVAIGDLLVGNANFSGKLSDTFFTKHAYNPVYANWIPQTYTGVSMATGTVQLDTNANCFNHYLVYQEGIYNGYRYTETRYEDVIMNRPGVGSFNYDEVVAYPFGYGISYTNYEYSAFTASHRASNDTYSVSVTVTNKGDVPGKESVQIYLQKPYTEYDKSNGVEKAAVELVGFAKTGILAKDEYQTVTVEIPGTYFASYDSNKAKTFILDGGDYYLTAAKDAHSAINNILKEKGRDVAGDKNFVWKRNVAAIDTVKYSKSAITGKDITNQFDNTDLNTYEGSTTTVKYLSRNDWVGTIKFGYSVAADGTRTKLNNSVQVAGTEKMKEDFTKPTVKPSDEVYPTYHEPYGKDETADMTLVEMLRIVENPKNATENTETVVEPFESEEWDKLLDMLSWNDMVTLLKSGFRATMGVTSISKPNTIDPNGPNGLVGHENTTAYSMDSNNGLANQKNDPDKNRSAAGYPCNGLVAATYNKELSRAFGKAWGEDCLWAGVSGLYGTAVNMHRGVYNGRTFEYFSEDSVLSGQIAANVTLGLRDKGVYSYLKHCVLNDSEAARKGMSTWANEQALREIYLKPFQIAIEEGKGENIMTGYNRLGVVWTSHQGFLNTVLRDEYGMTGFVVSDYYNTAYMTVPYAVLMGSDLPDGTMASGADDLNTYGPGKGYGELERAMRDAAKRILFTVVQSNAMNGYNTDTRIKFTYPDWPQTLETVQMVVLSVGAVLVAASATLLLLIELQKKGIIAAAS